MTGTGDDAGPPVPDWRVTVAREVRRARQELRALVETEYEANDQDPVPEPVGPRWPDPLPVEAYHGLAGEFVRAIEPHSEADPAALLVQFLIHAGNVVGRRPRYPVEGHYHHAAEYALIVGETASARKGTSRAQVVRVFRMVAPQWAAERLAGGLSSGEGVIWAVRDPITRAEPVRENGAVTEYRQVCIDGGVEDKRLLVYEPEFASVLRVMSRDGNTLSPVLRAAWDGETVLRIMTRNSPAQASDAHISLIAHVTAEELRRTLDRTEAGNGFLNRFLLVCARRSKLLPEGGSSLADDALRPVAERLMAALLAAEQVGEMRRSAAARELWAEMYGELTAGRPGLIGAVLSRAEAHVLRLGMLYALLDGSAVIEPVHLRAARAVWDYCASSALYVFGDALGDPVGDELLAALRQAPNGLTRAEIYDVLGRHVHRERIARTLAQLDGLGLATVRREATRGRPREVWFATRPRGRT